MKKLISVFGVLALLGLVFSCKSPSSPETPKVTVASVSVTSPNSAITEGQTEQMTATITMSDGSTKAATGTWGSDNPAVATVDQSGLVTAVAAGTVTIYIDVSASSLRSVNSTSGAASVSATSSGSKSAKTGLRGRKRMGKKAALRNDKNALEKGIETGNPLDTSEKMPPTATVRGSKSLTVRNVWSRSGTGANVFDMPTYVSRVKIVGDYRGSDPYIGDNFIVWVGDDLLVNVILGTYWGSTHYEGTHLTTGGVVQVKYSNGVVWSLTEVPVTTTLTTGSRNIPRLPGMSDAGNRKYQIYLNEAARKDK